MFDCCGAASLGFLVILSVVYSLVRLAATCRENPELLDHETHEV